MKSLEDVTLLKPGRANERSGADLLRKGRIIYVLKSCTISRRMFRYEMFMNGRMKGTGAHFSIDFSSFFLWRGNLEMGVTVTVV